MSGRRTERIYRSFHHAGLAVAVAFALLCVVVVFGLAEDNSGVGRARVEYLFGFLAISVVIYAAIRSLAWVADGFFGD